MSAFATLAVVLRLLNPHEFAVDVALHCGAEVRPALLAAREVRDVEGCASAAALVPLVALETSFDGEREWQRLLAADEECGTAAMAAPLFGCRDGVATAYVTPVDGATYEWTADGAVITAGAGTHRVAVQLGGRPTAALTCVITTRECARTATAAIAIREPIVVTRFDVPPTATANQPLTLTWSYEAGREPATQLLTGDLFTEAVLLGPAERSYTTTPQSGGPRTVELRASYGRTIPVAPPAKKRRRAVAGGVAASDCPSASATARVEVLGCATRDPILDAPVDVAAGETFQVRIIDLDDDAKVEWSVDNGTIIDRSFFGELVLITAGASGKTEVHVRVERSAGCFANATTSVAIIQPAAQCAVPPSADLTMYSTDCDSATVRAVFTGTPPFAGRWSDGTEFRTTSSQLYHHFRTTGTYGMIAFHDASCFGVVSGAPSAPTLKPTVKLAGVQGCAGGQLTATFTGNPPFSGTWSDGQPFATATTNITRSVGHGTWSVQNVTDANCSTATVKSNSVSFAPPPSASVRPGPECYLPRTEAYGALLVQIEGGKAPFVWEWTDGVVTTSGSPTAVRWADNGDAADRVYELKRASAAGCEATLENRTVLLHKRYEATMPGGSKTYCTGSDITVASPWEPSPDAQLTWSLWAYGFTPAVPKIVSGQGTTALTFRSNVRGNAYLYLETTFPGKTCRYRAPTQNITFENEVTVSNLTIDPPAIKTWGTAKLSVHVDGKPISLWISAEGRPGAVRMDSCCSATYVDIAGPGIVPIVVRWSDCTGSHETRGTLTITE